MGQEAWEDTATLHNSSQLQPKKNISNAVIPRDSRRGAGDPTIGNNSE